MQKITPFLWFDDNAEEAMNFYTSIFKNSRVLDVQRYGKEGPLPEGTLFTATFQLEGQEFSVLNGGPGFTFSESISFFVDCKSQQEVDHLWMKLADGGEEQPCGWLKDKYGLSWQIIPTELIEMLQDKDLQKASRARDAMFQMKKIDLKTLQKAFDQG